MILCVQHRSSSFDSMSYGNSRVIIKPRRPHIVYQLHLFFFFQLLAAVTTPSVFVPGPKACPTELPCTHDTRHMRASMVLFNGIATVRAFFNINWSNSTSIISDQLCIVFCLSMEKCCLWAWSWPMRLRLTSKTPVLTTTAAYWHWNNSILGFSGLRCHDSQLTFVSRAPLPRGTCLHIFL